MVFFGDVRNRTEEKLDTALVGEENHRASPFRLYKIFKKLVSFFKDRLHYVLQKSEMSYMLLSQHHTNPPTTCRDAWSEQEAAGGVWKWASTPCSA